VGDAPGTTNARLAECATPTPPPAPSNAYKLGDALVAAYPLPNGATTRGRFVIPAAGVSAECDGALMQVGFLQRVPRSLKVSWSGGGFVEEDIFCI